MDIHQAGLEFGHSCIDTLDRDNKAPGRTCMSFHFLDIDRQASNRGRGYPHGLNEQ